MLNIFELLDNLIFEKRELENSLQLQILYHQELIDLQYHYSAILKNPEACLDYISFLEYTKCSSNELKPILYTMEEEQKTLQARMSFLDTIIHAYLKSIVASSNLSYQEGFLLCRYFHFVPNQVVLSENSNLTFFILDGDELFLNPKLQGISSDAVEFMKYYINLKMVLPDKEYTLTDAYTMYNQEYPKLELV